jgi:hypothetical protein
MLKLCTARPVVLPCAGTITPTRESWRTTTRLHSRTRARTRGCEAFCVPASWYSTAKCGVPDAGCDVLCRCVVRFSGVPIRLVVFWMWCNAYCSTGGTESRDEWASIGFRTWSIWRNHFCLVQSKYDSLLYEFTKHQQIITVRFHAETSTQTLKEFTKYEQAITTGFHAKMSIIRGTQSKRVARS